MLLTDQILLPVYLYLVSYWAIGVLTKLRRSKFCNQSYISKSSRFSCTTKKVRQKFKYLENKKNS